MSACPPLGLVCALCGEVSRRASRISCCRAQCCWNCGVRFITRERKCWSCPSVNLVTQNLEKDTALREQIKVWSSQNSAELELPQPVALLTSGGVAPSEPPAASEADEVNEVKPTIIEPVARDEEVKSVSEVNENIPEDLIQTIAEVKEDHLIQTSTEVKEDIPEDHLIETSTEGKDDIREVTNNAQRSPPPHQLGVITEEPGVPLVPTEPVERVVEKLDVKAQDSGQSEKECSEDSSLISAETAALLFDSVEENPVTKKNPVKIELKASFKKLSDRIQADRIPQIEEDLEMFENKNCRDLVEPEETNKVETVENSNVESREIRILKVVDDEKTFDKINQIKVELDRTRKITSRRKSEDLKPTVKPFEVKPIKNALQGLQALLKLSGGSNPSDKNTKTDSAKQRERKAAKAESSKSRDSRCDSKTDRRRSSSRSRSRNSPSKDEKRSKGRSGSSQVSSRRRSKSRSPTKIIRSRSRSRTDRSQEDGTKEGYRYSSRSSSSRHSSSRTCRGRSRSRETSSRASIMSSSSRSTKINRAAVVRDSQVEDDCKTLVENNLRDPDKSTPVIKTNLSDSKKKKVVEPEDDEIKVVSYKDVRPRCEDDGHIRIIRTIDNIETEEANQTSKRAKRRASTSPEKSTKKVVSKFVEKERIVRKVYAVEKSVDGVSNFEKVTLEKSVKQTKEIHSQEPSRDRDSVTPDDRKTSLEQIKEELERVKNRVDNMKNKPGQEEEESDSEVDMISIMKDVKQMEAEVRDISEDVDVKAKSKKRKKDKEKADGGKSKGKEAEIKKVKEDLESSKRKKNNNETNNKDIEIDSKLAKKILTSILGTNIGKTLNDVIRKEVDRTDHTIEKIKEDLKKQKEEKSKKKRRKEKEDKEYEGGSTKKFKTDEDQSSSRKDKKKSSLEMEPKYIEEDHRQQRKKSKKEKSKSPSRESRKKRKEGESKAVSKKKKSKSSRDKERHKKKKSKKKDRRDCQSDIDHEETTEVVDEKKVDEIEKNAEHSDPEKEEFELVIGITEDDVAYLDPERDDVSSKEPKLIVEKSDCRSGTASHVASDQEEDGADSEDDEVNLRALLLSQMAGRNPRARSGSRAKISWPGSPRRQQSEEAESGGNYALPQYAYAYSRTFITHEEKQLYFPNLFSATLVELEYSESESECEAECEEIWDQRRTTNWVTSRMADPRFSQAMESLLRQSSSRDSRSPEDYGGF